VKIQKDREERIIRGINNLAQDFSTELLAELLAEVKELRNKNDLTSVIAWLENTSISSVSCVLAVLYESEGLYSLAKEHALKAEDLFPDSYWEELLRNAIVSSVSENIAHRKMRESTHTPRLI